MENIKTFVGDRPELLFKLAYSDGEIVDNVEEKNLKALDSIGFIDMDRTIRNDRGSSFLVSYRKQYRCGLSELGKEAAKVAKQLVAERNRNV